MPQRLDRDDALALARQGKDAWNAWAEQNPGTEVDFSGATLKDIPFAGFQFPGHADFHGVTISGPALFRRAIFFADVSFSGAEFSSTAHFNEAKFFGDAFFGRAKFSSVAYFHQSIFSGQSDVDGRASFSGVEFLDDADFTKAKFDIWTCFDGSEFSGQAYFMGTTFLHMSDFSGGKFSRGASFHNTYFRKFVNFSDCNFDGQTDFRVKSFSEAPRFHGVSARQGIQFGNIDDFFADFVKNGDEESYRALKLAMGQQQARTEEAAFAALELKARRYRLLREAKAKPFWKRIPLWAECLGYWSWEFFSKSGRGFLRPLAGYLVFLGAFAASYVLPCQGWRGDWGAGVHYAFLKQFPFAAAFRGGTNHLANLEQALFAATSLPGWVTALNSAQSLLALTLIFLMGLGIRHKFRLR